MKNKLKQLLLGLLQRQDGAAQRQVAVPQEYKRVDEVCDNCGKPIYYLKRGSLAGYAPSNWMHREKDDTHLATLGGHTNPFKYDLPFSMTSNSSKVYK